MHNKILLTCIVITILAGCRQTSKKEDKILTPTVNFINPPIPGANVLYKEYIVDALKGDTLFYNTGSILYFPPNSFADKDGNPVQGNVQIKYREFADPMDFYLSGISMSYDSAGKAYTFESSGMCEVLAFKDGVPVFVNLKSKPEIYLAGTNNSPFHNLYYLDTVQKKWMYKGLNTVIDISAINNKKTVRAIASDEEITPPIKPEKANDKSPVIKIVIDPASFAELLVYDNLQFQLDDKEKGFNPHDTSYEWTNVELLKGASKGLYTVKFTNPKKTVSYSARPVLEAKDYDNALKVFEKNNDIYRRRLNKRLFKEEAKKEKYIKDSLENIQVIAQNKITTKLNAFIEARNKQIEKENAEIEKLDKLNAEIVRFNKVIRGFKLDGFGFWNCDRVMIPDAMEIKAVFKDEKGTTLDLTYIAVLNKSANGIQRFVSNNIFLVIGAEQMIVGISNGKLSYLTYENYRKLGINESTKEHVFIMKVVAEKDNNYEYIKKISEQQ